MSGYPTAWGRFDRNMPSAQPSWFGFDADVNQMNQFAARFRLANSFTSIDLDGYGDNTVAGYSSLFRTLLVWSMFEQYLKVRGLRQRDCETLLDEHGMRPEARRIINDADRDFFRFINRRLHPPHQRALAEIFGGRSDNVSYLASTIRHIFAHGVLNPHAGGVEPEEVIRVCDAVSEFLLRLVDQDFERRVEWFENAIESPSSGFEHI